MKKQKFKVVFTHIIYFYLSFIAAGTLYVIPQIFLLRYYPDNKNTYLSLFIIVGAIVSIFGIWLSQKRFITGRLVNKQKIIIPLLMLSVMILFCLQFQISSLESYFVVFILVKFVSNFLYSYLDIVFSCSASQDELGIHVKAMLIYQMMANIIAPVYFSFLYFETLINIIALSVFGIISFAAVKKYIKSFQPGKQKQTVSRQMVKLNACHRSFLLYVLLILTGVTMVSTTYIYILRDYYRYADAVQKGGLLIAISSVFSIIAILLPTGIAAKRNQDVDKLEPKQLSPLINFLVMGLFGLSAVLLYFRLSYSFLYLLITAVLFGYAFGLFLKNTRNFASSQSVIVNVKLLSFYNNMPNIGILVALGIIFVITHMANSLEVEYNRFLLITIMMVCSTSFFAFINLLRG